ncbi:alpha-E domain-containing protein [Qingshengfaniella alkalisoli]|uniref:Alpha-E domain-containing protein n=1 Tax=Qingshengfaniella alkalisoli TaxID=2599296 RepID=A0A5B8IXF1_9RHOB|nr:alpha-E domain-containing protein [Qingshengfaniella alkalisoli]QDY69268.1 alpha-E domain-containing protein [Qingshengfaniella alkalisoli]
MLSRTADNLYWLSRYLERAETTARLLDVGSRIQLLPDTAKGYRSEWEAILKASGSMGQFTQKYGEAVERNVVSHMFFDRDNPSSVASCIFHLRENARIVRTALTGDVWDAINGAYQELEQLARTERSELDLSTLTEWTSRQGALIQGTIYATQLRNDGYDFLYLGYNLEKADNTARLLDVKYFVLLPDIAYVGSGMDNFQWMILLRSMRMHRAFHWAYGGDVTPAKIVDLLILNPQCPRSFRTAIDEASRYLLNLSKEYDRPQRADEMVMTIRDELHGLTSDAIFDEGLHEFITRFERQVAELSSEIQNTYLRGVQ